MFSLCMYELTGHPGVSALGQKRTFRHLIAASVYPLQRTCALHLAMSAKGQKRASAISFDHVVRALLKMKRYVESESLGGLDIDNQLKLGRLFDR
jgi:hypothetical protein